MTDRLVIDAKASGCQKTTRIAQAIETVQGLLFSAHQSVGSAQTLNLTLAPDFDEEWRWIGSYATARRDVRVHVPREHRGQPPPPADAGLPRLVKAIREAAG